MAKTPEDHDSDSSPNRGPEVLAGLPELMHLPQEIALDDPASRYLFRPSDTKPLVATPAALEKFGLEAILQCLYRLQFKARVHYGLDYLQIFEVSGQGDQLWFIEDNAGGAITALLPSDY